MQRNLKLSDFIFDLSEEGRETLRATRPYIAFLNMSRIRFFSLFFFLFVLGGLIYQIFMSNPDVIWQTTPAGRTLFILRVIGAIVNLSVLIGISLYLPERSENGKRSERWFALIYTGFILYWTVGLTVTALSNNLGILIYVVVCLGSAAMMLTSMGETFVIYIGGWIGLLCGILLLVPDGSMKNHYIVASSMVTIVALVISRVQLYEAIRNKIAYDRLKAFNDDLGNGYTSLIQSVDMLESELAENKRKVLELEKQNRELSVTVLHYLPDFQSVEMITKRVLQPLDRVKTTLDRTQRNLREKIDRPILPVLEESVSELSRIYETVDEVRRYSEVISERLQIEPVDINLVLHKVKNNLGGLIESSKARIMLSDLPVIVGDRTQLTSLFQFLIENSIGGGNPKHTPHIQIESVPQDSDYLFNILYSNPDGNYIESGSEPAKDDTSDAGDLPINSIFVLPVCKQIIEKHGGRVRAHSHAEDKSLFSFTLPKR